MIAGRVRRGVLAMVLAFTAMLGLVPPVQAETRPYVGRAWGHCTYDPLGNPNLFYVTIFAPSVHASAASGYTSQTPEVTYTGVGEDPVYTYPSRQTGYQRVWWRAKLAWRTTDGGWGIHTAPFWFTDLGGTQLGTYWQRWTGSGEAPLDANWMMGGFAHFSFPVYAGRLWLGQEAYWGDFAGSISTDWINRRHSDWMVEQVVSRETCR